MQLFEWQRPYADRAQPLFDSGAALLALPPGAGKTYIAMQLIKESDEAALVVCPKSVIPTWERVSAEFGCASRVRVLNYEQLTSPNSKLAKSGLIGKWRGKHWQWNFRPEDGLRIVYDEAHRTNGYKTKAHTLPVNGKAQGIKQMMLTATPPDSPLKMKALGVCMGLFHPTGFWDWALNHGVRKSRFHQGFEFPTKSDAEQEAADFYLEKIHHSIFGDGGRGVVMLHEELLKHFPEGHTYVEPCALEASEAFVAKNAERFAELEEKVEKAELRVVEDLRIHQMIEYHKIPIFKERAQDLLSVGQSVAIFVNFRDTAERLCKELKTDCLIIGQQRASLRAENLDRFQCNEEKLIILTAAAGGEAISLHDIDGRHPRTSLISPVWDPVKLKQVRGRIHRAGGKSPVNQQILVLPGIEERIYKSCLTRLGNMGTLVGDVEGFTI